MTRNFDVVVVGSGIIGATLAAMLASRRLANAERIACIGATLPTAPAVGRPLDVRVFALSRASQSLLKTADIWERLPAQSVCAYQNMCVWDASIAPRSAAALRFEAADIAEPDLGHIVESRALHWEAVEAARRAGVVQIESAVQSMQISESAADLGLADGRSVAAQLVVAADGVGSNLRGLRGIDAPGHSYHQMAIVAHVSTERPHESTAWQRFLPGGPLAFLPLADGRSSIVWSIDLIHGNRHLACGEADFEAALNLASDGVLGACRLTTARLSFPLQMRYAEDYAHPRFVLVGDAAHSVHPLAGQGLNLGLRDCRALLDVLDAAGDEQLGEISVLRRYERSRKTNNFLAATALDGLNRLFSNSNPVLRGLRTFGLTAVSRSAPLKHFLARQALGL